MDENTPVLVSTKSLEGDFEKLANIQLTCNHFTLGRGLNNNQVVPFLPISRNHCTFRRVNDEWLIEDNSSFGICVNGHKLGKGNRKRLSHKDIIILEPSQQFVYEFTNQSDDFEIPRKRIKLENTDDDDDFINDVKIKFEESQSYEIKHIEDKIQSAKNMKETSRILKTQLQLDMDRKMKQLESDFALQIENLEGEKQEVERQKTVLLAERDTQLAGIKEQMEGKILELKDQINKHNESEAELIKENSNLKEKLLKEREEFLAEISRESLSKQETLDKLNAKIKEQEEIRIKEKEELEIKLRNETEQLRLAKEKELKELEDQKKQREKELEEELSSIKVNLEQQIQQAEQERLKAEQLLNEQMEERKKLNDEEKIKREELMQEREEIQKKLAEAQVNAEKSIKELKARVEEREIELTALAADRIQKQVEQSSEVIVSLQDQLEKVKSQLQSVETEKQSLLESVQKSSQLDGAGSSKQSTLAEVGELMESELQCSICAELFVAATTLNCSHTFCKYCITMWKKKKKDCPICRTSITSECKSLVLDSFIDKMVQNLTEEMKIKRQEMLKSREELESELLRQQNVRTSRGSDSYDESEYNSDSELVEEGEEEEDYYGEQDDYDDYWPRRIWRPRYYADDTSDDDSGSDEYGSDASASGAGAAAAAAGPADAGAGAGVSDSAERGPSGNGVSRRAPRVEGLPGAYYGGYGRCYSCGARGHWAPGCPNR